VTAVSLVINWIMPLATVGECVDGYEVRKLFGLAHQAAVKRRAFSVIKLQTKSFAYLESMKSGPPSAD
jgi:hypothetical protein